jgi:hypothetical protein
MELNVAIGLGLAVLGTVGFFLWLPYVRHRLHKHQVIHHPAPATMELRDEPPAIVNLLVHELELDADALAATLLDLAARGHLEIVELSERENVVLVKARDRAGLTTYDLLVLGVVERAAAGQPHATVAAIGQALGPGSATQWFAFKRQVDLDAQQRGLVRKAPTSYGVKALTVLCLLPTAGVAVAVPFAAAILTPIVFIALLLGGIILLVRGRHTILTDKGVEAGAHWLGVRQFVADYGSFADLPPAAVAVWDRFLAYGAAMGLSDQAVHGLVTELRTHLSMHDVHQAASSVHLMMRMANDPAAQAQWRQQVMAQQWGPNADPSQPYGPDSGDFWALLANTGRGWPVAAMSCRSDPDLFRRSSNDRIDKLVAAAPAELAADVATISAPARAYVELMAGAGAMNGSLPFAGQHDEHVEAAFTHVITALAAHYGVAPNAQAVMAALMGQGQGVAFTAPPTPSG